MLKQIVITALVINCIGLIAEKSKQLSDQGKSKELTVLNWDIWVLPGWMQPPVRKLLSWDGYGPGMSKDRFEYAVDKIVGSFDQDVLCLQGIPDYWYKSFDLRGKKSFQLLKLLQDKLQERYVIVDKVLSKNQGIITIFVKKDMFTIVSSESGASKLINDGAAAWVTLETESGKKIKIISLYIDPIAGNVSKQLESLVQLVGDISMPILLCGNVTEYGRGDVSEFDLKIDSAFKGEFSWYDHRSETVRVPQAVKSKVNNKIIGYKKTLNSIDHIFYSSGIVIDKSKSYIGKIGGSVGWEFSSEFPVTHLPMVVHCEF